MTAFTCSRSRPSYHFMMSSRLAPASRFSKMADTGIRVPFNTHAPLTLPGTLSTAEHRDQSRPAIEGTPVQSIASLNPGIKESGGVGSCEIPDETPILH